MTRLVNPDGSWCQPFQPTLLPATWRETRAPYGAVAAYLHVGGMLSLISSWEHYPEHGPQEWLHISLAGRTRLPTWQELVDAKEAFIGIEEEALSVLPRRSDWLNEHQYCIHLWHRIGAPLMLDITRKD